MKLNLQIFPRQRRPEPRLPVISAPFMFRREETAEVKSILEAFNTQLPGGLPPQLDLNSLDPTSAMRDYFGAQPPRHFDNNDMDLSSSHQHLRPVLSSPELRTPASGSMSQTLPAMPALRAVSSRHSDSYRRPRPTSWFSIKTDIIEGRRTAVRRVLDTIGCTKGDQFDLHEFKRVRAPTQGLRTTTSRTFVHPRRPSVISFTQFMPRVPKIVVTSTRN